MMLRQKNEIIKWAEGKTDEELEKEYYKAVDDSLGSQTERMCELGYDAIDITEREKHERYFREKVSVLEMLCSKRDIALWE